MTQIIIEPDSILRTWEEIQPEADKQLSPKLKKKKKCTRGKLRPGEECCPWLWLGVCANKNVPEKKDRNPAE